MALIDQLGYGIACVEILAIEQVSREYCDDVVVVIAEFAVRCLQLEFGRDRCAFKIANFFDQPLISNLPACASKRLVVRIAYELTQGQRWIFVLNRLITIIRIIQWWQLSVIRVTAKRSTMR